MAGANAIFAGDKLLTTPNPAFEEDNAMFSLLGLTPMEAFRNEVGDRKQKVIVGENAE